MTDPKPSTGRRKLAIFLGIAAVSAVLLFLVTGLLMSIFERKREALNPYVRLVEVSEETTDPAAWGVNWAREFDDYKRTVDTTRTRFGGSEALPEQKAKAFPWLTRMFAAPSFSTVWRYSRAFRV